MESKFTGGLLGKIGTGILCTALIIFTLGLGTPWAVCIKQNWYTKHTIIDGKQLYFDGTGMQLFGTYLKRVLLVIVTFGIYSFWVGLSMQKWVTKHTHTVANQINA